MAAGLPIVASDLPSLREALAGRAGVVYASPDDPESLGLALSEALEGRLASSPALEATWARRAERLLEAMRTPLDS